MDTATLIGLVGGLACIAFSMITAGVSVTTESLGFSVLPMLVLGYDSR